MMGRLAVGQERLFYHFRLEDQVPANHLLRKLDALLDLDMVRKQLESLYSEIGRPSVDPAQDAREQRSWHRHLGESGRPLNGRGPRSWHRSSPACRAVS